MSSNVLHQYSVGLIPLNEGNKGANGQLSVSVLVTLPTQPGWTPHQAVRIVGFLIHLWHLLPHFKHVISYFHNLANKYQRG